MGPQSRPNSIKDHGVGTGTGTTGVNSQEHPKADMSLTATGPRFNMYGSTEAQNERRWILLSAEKVPKENGKPSTSKEHADVRLDGKKKGQRIRVMRRRGGFGVVWPKKSKSSASPGDEGIWWLEGSANKPRQKAEGKGSIRGRKHLYKASVQDKSVALVSNVEGDPAKKLPRKLVKSRRDSKDVDQDRKSIAKKLRMFVRAKIGREDEDRILSSWQLEAIAPIRDAERNDSTPVRTDLYGATLSPETSPTLCPSSFLSSSPAPVRASPSSNISALELSSSISATEHADDDPVNSPQDKRVFGKLRGITRRFLKLLSDGGRKVWGIGKGKGNAIEESGNPVVSEASNIDGHTSTVGSLPETAPAADHGNGTTIVGHQEGASNPTILLHRASQNSIPCDSDSPSRTSDNDPTNVAESAGVPDGVPAITSEDSSPTATMGAVDPTVVTAKENEVASPTDPASPVIVDAEVDGQHTLCADEVVSQPNADAVPSLGSQVPVPISSPPRPIEAQVPVPLSSPPRPTVQSTPSQQTIKQRRPRRVRVPSAYTTEVYAQPVISLEHATLEGVDEVSARNVRHMCLMMSGDTGFCMCEHLLGQTSSRFRSSTVARPRSVDVQGPILVTRIRGIA